MINIEVKHKKIKEKYDKGMLPLDELKDITRYCLLLISETAVHEYGRVGIKNYVCYFNNLYSRPVATELFIWDHEEFEYFWDLFISSIDGSSFTSSLGVRDIDRVLYTAIMSFAICFDIWKNQSRKTPGTHFEVLLGSILSLFLQGYARRKHIILPDNVQLSTDICFSSDDKTLVFPAKTTTRERIVQPYAHQRILDSLSPGTYKSILLCVSETQRDNKNNRVNDICVPGTIKLYQAHLAHMSGIYYLDPPIRYLNEDILGLVNVSSIGQFLKYDLAKVIANRIV